MNPEVETANTDFMIWAVMFGILIAAAIALAIWSKYQQ